MPDFEDNYYDWCDYFFQNIDIGPAQDDVVAMMYENYKEETGNIVESME